MNERTVFNILSLLLALGLVAFITQAIPGAQTSPVSASLNSTAVPSLTPTPNLSSVETRKILTYLIEREGIAAENLVIVNEFRREATLLTRMFRAVTVMDLESGRFYQMLVDLDSGQVENRTTIEAAEEQHQRARYGKLQPALYERFQTMGDDETVTVTIWVAAQPGGSLAERQAAAFVTLAARYPQAQVAMERSGKPMDVDDPALAERIYDEYVQILDAETVSRIRPLTEALEARGFVVRTSPGLPAVTVTLPKESIQMLAARDDVGVIYLSEGGQRRLFLNTAVPTNLAPAVWARGYDGTGVDIAILEEDNVDFTSNTTDCPTDSNNCFQHPGATLVGVSGEDWHVTLVASAAASNHATHRGMAPGATIVSAGIQGPDRQDDIDALVWAFDQGAQVVNASYGWCPGSTQMDDIDWAFDHYARARLRLFVAAAGNNDALCPSDYVDSPAKGWNVLSVGAYDDQNDSNWSNDVMAGFSAWDNPDSPNGDHEKPEVVAPGVEIVGVGLDGQLVTNPNLNSGTSFAAPQVAGLAALLIDRHSSLTVWPEANRAIIMASATPNNGLQPTALRARQSAIKPALWLVLLRRCLPRTRTAAEP